MSSGLSRRARATNARARERGKRKRKRKMREGEKRRTHAATDTCLWCSPCTVHRVHSLHLDHSMGNREDERPRRHDLGHDGGRHDGGGHNGGGHIEPIVIRIHPARVHSSRVRGVRGGIRLPAFERNGSVCECECVRLQCDDYMYVLVSGVRLWGTCFATLEYSVLDK